FSSRRRHTRFSRDWSSDVCSSDLIRRVTQNLDPRGYEVVPVAAPNDVEKAHHYLWRFWQHMPKAGHITIFDRTWYGRVLVERVEIGRASCRERLEITAVGGYVNKK